MVNIHPTAIIHSGAQLGENVEIGAYTIIEDDVLVGDNCKIQSHVYIDSGTRLGNNIFVAKGAVLGTAPQDLKYKGEKTYLEVGDNTRIREFVTMNRGTDYHYKTVVGQDCLVMAYVHIAHDCIVGNNVILSNAIQMAGHVVIDDFAGIGGLVAIHQFVRIGTHSFVGGGLRVPKDVPPYILAMGEPLKYGGVNNVGLSRRGFSEEVITEIKRAYRLLLRSSLTQKEALQKICEELKPLPEIEVIVNFLQGSQRGVVRG